VFWGITILRGDELILLQECTGAAIVPEGRIAIACGRHRKQHTRHYNNIGRALEGKPVTHSFVQVGGAVKAPGIWSVPVGVEASEMIQAAGGISVNDPNIYRWRSDDGAIPQGCQFPNF